MATRRKLIVSSLILCLSFANEAFAAQSSPKFNVGCYDSVSTGYDSGGAFREYKPTISANFVGKSASIKVYLNGVQQSTLKFTRNSSSYNELARFNAPIKIYRNQISLGRNSFKYLFSDSKQNLAAWVCEIDLYESSFGSAPSSPSGFSKGGFDARNCTFNGKKLYGSVYVTPYSSFADISVYVTPYSSFADLNVYETSYQSFASSCGIWYQTKYSSFADFTIYLTPYESFADFSIYFTPYQSFAGVN